VINSSVLYKCNLIFNKQLTVSTYNSPNNGHFYIFDCRIYVFNVFVPNSNLEPSFLSNASVYKLPRCHDDQYTVAAARCHGEAETADAGGKLFALSSSGNNRRAWNQLAAMSMYDRSTAIIALSTIVNIAILFADVIIVMEIRLKLTFACSYWKFIQRLWWEF